MAVGLSPTNKYSSLLNGACLFDLTRIVKGRAIMHSIHLLFEAQVRQQPNAIAAVFDNQSISYAELNKKANQLANYIKNHGVKQDVSVAICMDRSIDLLVVMLGILKAGAAYVPLDPSHPKERLLFILSDNNSPLLVTTSNHKEQFHDYQGVSVFVDTIQSELDVCQKLNLSQDAGDENLAYIIYTSGSTGNPKGVLIEHRSVCNYSRWFSEYAKVIPGQRIDFSSNYIFDMAVTTSIVPLMLGLTIVICDDKIKKNTRRYLHYIESNQINMIKLTPSYLKVLTDEAKNTMHSLPDLKTLILGGENLNASECRAWLNLYPSHVLFNEYGPTESTVGVSVCEINHQNLHQFSVAIPIGIPDTKAHFYILNSDKSLVEKGETGELYIGGVCLARGYLNQPELTAQKFIRAPAHLLNAHRLYQTGDLCCQSKDGVIEYFGRVDHQVKIHGFRIELEEIERCLIKHPLIKEVIVLAQESHSHEKQLIAYYIPKNAKSIPETEKFRHFLNERLPNYMIPTAFVWVDSFPRTANDKLDRAALPVPKFSSKQHYVAPRTAVEKKIANIWSSALGVKLIGIEDNFFELGGHSLMAARIVSEIEQKLGKNISLDDFYQAATIRKLMQVIKIAKHLDPQAIHPSLPKRFLRTPPLNDFQFMFWIGHLIEPKLKNINVVGRRRLKGLLNVATLNAAFESILKKHEILLYRTHKFSPTQFILKKVNIRVEEISLNGLSKNACELALLSSYDKLVNYTWPHDKPNIVATLFHLKNNLSELQISMPHIISDFISIDILFDNLSNFYFLHQCQVNTVEFYSQTPFKKHLATENYLAEIHLDEDVDFWGNYLKDTGFFYFQADYVIKDMDAAGYPYSTYFEIPEQSIVQLRKYCAEKQLTLIDGLSASLSLALNQYRDAHRTTNKKIFISLIKTSRDKPIYDDKIGCFLRLDAIKVDLSEQQDFEKMSKQIHQSTLDTMAYQRCPGLAKLSCVNDLDWHFSVSTNYILNGCIYVYTKIFRALHYKFFSLYLRLISFWKTDSFLIYINVLTNFLQNTSEKKESNLFGLETVPPRLYQYDLSKINHVLEVCFLRDENKNKPYLVISGNIMPEIREKIGKKMLNIIQNETVISQPLKATTEPESINSGG